ncbi:MAG TPA: hypothetical protein VLA36_03960 [Longimicrobiales bacterium]|nr:hypothetical protein [Longimicrobiales bacterium]
MATEPESRPSSDPEGVHPDAVELARRLAEAGGGSVQGILMYGSHLLGAAPDRYSALDFVVVVDDYRRFYRSLHEKGEIHRPARLLWVASRVLPPNVIAYTPDDGEGGIAKCLVVSDADLAKALSPAAPDHFLIARLIQRVALVWRSDVERGSRILALLAEAHQNVLRWAAPYLDPTVPFDAERLGRELLSICYAGEFRPEAKNRSETIFASQREHFGRVLAPVLERAAREGRLLKLAGGYGLAEAPTPAEIRRWRRYFRRSKARVTARWFKHVLTFDNWLPYILRKVERRMGRKVELTRIERALPVPFLLPRAVALLFTRPEREEPR